MATLAPVSLRSAMIAPAHDGVANCENDREALRVRAVSSVPGSARAIDWPAMESLAHVLPL